MREAVLRYPLSKIKIEPYSPKPNEFLGIKRASLLLPLDSACQEALSYLVGAVVHYTRIRDAARGYDFVGTVDFLFRSSDEMTGLPMVMDDGIQTVFYEGDLSAFNACFLGNARVVKRTGETDQPAMKSDDAKWERALENLSASAWLVMNEIARIEHQESEDLKARLIVMKRYILEAEQLLAKEKV